MPSVVVKLYSVFFKLLLKHKLLNPGQPTGKDGYGAVSRPSGKGVTANASFVDGVATKDINIDPFTSLSLRIFLPQSALPQDGIAQSGRTGLLAFSVREDSDGIAAEQRTGARRGSYEGREDYRGHLRRDSHGHGEIRRNGYVGKTRKPGYGGEVMKDRETRRDSYSREHLQETRSDLTEGYAKLDVSRESGGLSIDDRHSEDAIYNHGADFEDSCGVELIQNGFQDRGDKGDMKQEAVNYQGYVPATSAHAYKKLPVIVQFHGGGFVTGSKDSAANDLFCRRMAKLLHAIVVAVGYRLAPEHKYPAAFDDGFEALCWLAKQANLAECNKSFEHIPHGFSRSGSDIHRSDLHRELVDSFGGTVVEPWLSAHGDLSRCVLLGVSSGGNIADHVARRATLAGKLLEPVKIVAQVLMYPFFIGSIPTRSELKLANSYFYDKATCILAWKLFLPDDEYDIDHPAANPLVSERVPPLKEMPPTLTVVPELDWMKDRAIAYSEALRKVNIDAPVLEYKDAVHEFATLDFLVNSRQAEACAEDMAIWIKKYISLKGYEFSY